MAERNFKKYIPIVAIVLVVLAALAISGYFYYQYQNTKKQLDVNPATGVPQVNDLVEKVGKLMELPNGETPTVAAVSDVSKLHGQTFFAHAQNGDQVLIYSQAKKAILYRPSTNKIIEVGPVNLAPSGAPAETASGSASTNPTGTQVRVVLLNGTTTVGLTKKAETTLTDKDASVTVTDRDNAAKQDYEKTLVIDLTGKNAEKAKAIASVVKGEVGKLPSGESKPDADILIILGKDYTQ